MEGVIVKGVGGFYYVETEGGRIYSCRARGLFKKLGLVPTVGDRVDMEALDEEEGVVTSIHKRKNVFIRPSVANVDQIVIMAPAAEPEANFSIIDGLTVMAERAFVDVIIAISKKDLGDFTKAEKVYGPIYKTIPICAVKGEGIEELRKFLKGKISALTGQSGAGKSTLINRLMGEAVAQTGNISRKSMAGRHTTRHVEIFRTAPDEMVLDTPGFTSFEVPGGKEAELDSCFPEMRDFLGRCRYNNCRHVSEPECAVREAVDKGKISGSRYESYLWQLKELEEKNRNYR